MNKKRALGDDPLFSSSGSTPTKENKSSDFSDIVSDQRLEEVKKQISSMRKEVKKLERQKKNRDDEYQRMTFIVRKDLLEKLRNYCYTERLSQKDGLERALSEFLDEKKDSSRVRIRSRRGAENDKNT